MVLDCKKYDQFIPKELNGLYAMAIEDIEDTELQELQESTLQILQESEQAKANISLTTAAIRPT